MGDVATMIGPDEALAIASARPSDCLPGWSPWPGVRTSSGRAGRRRPRLPAVSPGYDGRLRGARCDAGKAVRVVAELAAGQAARDAVAEGHCLEIMTGAPCPAGTEAVVPKEEVQRQGAERGVAPTNRRWAAHCTAGERVPVGADAVGARLGDHAAGRGGPGLDRPDDACPSSLPLPWR